MVPACLMLGGRPLFVFPCTLQRGEPVGAAACARRQAAPTRPETPAPLCVLFPGGGWGAVCCSGLAVPLPRAGGRQGPRCPPRGPRLVVLHCPASLAASAPKHSEEPLCRHRLPPRPSILRSPPHAQALGKPCASPWASPGLSCLGEGILELPRCRRRGVGVLSVAAVGCVPPACRLPERCRCEAGWGSSWAGSCPGQGLLHGTAVMA